jgi:hypothetical protein
MELTTKTMLAVQENSPNVFTEIYSEHSITFNDILHPWQIVELWTDAELAAIKVYRVQPAVIPDGKRPTIGGGYTFARDANGVVQQILVLEDIPKPPPPVISASPRQIRLALSQIGIRQQVEDYVNTQSITVQDNWHYASIFYPDNALLIAAAAALGKTSADIDALFKLAASIGDDVVTPPPVQKVG